ncbi:unnamed protein product [Chilo suppressalis]|uniref:Uncharacterized protein n=1 Tax=Chilo suppressalis TaxID=168631 RepID=A0ABN8AYB5_CHISP|nr:unnamed protein product [Chilo suppressalis]
MAALLPGVATGPDTSTKAFSTSFQHSMPAQFCSPGADFLHRIRVLTDVSSSRYMPLCHFTATTTLHSPSFSSGHNNGATEQYHHGLAFKFADELNSKNSIESAAAIIECIFSEIEGNKVVYTSINTVVEQDDATHYPEEFLNYLHTIEAEILTACGVGEAVFIPRIPLIPHNFPFQFKCGQFPVSVCFAMTIKKSQRQILRAVGGCTSLAPASPLLTLFTFWLWRAKPLMLFIEKSFNGLMCLNKTKIMRRLKVDTLCNRLNVCIPPNNTLRYCCTKLASPNARHSDRSWATRIQLLPATNQELHIRTNLSAHLEF